MYAVLDPTYVENQVQAVYIGGQGRIIMTDKHKVYKITPNAKGENPLARKAQGVKRVELFTTEKDAQEFLERRYAGHTFEWQKAKTTAKVESKPNETTETEKPKTTTRKRKTTE